MFSKITNDTKMDYGSRIKRTYSNGRVEFYTLKEFISNTQGYELTFDGINSGVDSGMVLCATKEGMVAQGWEIEC